MRSVISPTSRGWSANVSTKASASAAGLSPSRTRMVPCRPWSRFRVKGEREWWSCESGLPRAFRDSDVEFGVWFRGHGPFAI